MGARITWRSRLKKVQDRVNREVIFCAPPAGTRDRSAQAVPSLGPGCDDRRAPHEGPLVVVGGDHSEAVGFGCQVEQ
jgi:hypothetical protein